MPEMDGIELVKRVSNENSDIAFVMLSKVTDKEMVAQAYDAGIEFFIHKPVNLREIIAVLRNVAEKKKINSMMNDIKGIFKNDNRKEELDGKFDASDDGANAISMFLGMLGMNGEKGTADILALCQYLIKKGESYNKKALEEVAQSRGDTSKNMEQRMRRAIKKGLSNVASIGLSDYGNDIFQLYANYVFDFKSIKDEMECIEGRNENGGRVAIPKFVEGLLMYKNSYNG